MKFTIMTAGGVSIPQFSLEIERSSLQSVVDYVSSFCHNFSKNHFNIYDESGKFLANVESKPQAHVHYQKES